MKYLSCLLVVLLPVLASAQTEGPEGAMRWEKGASWNSDGTIDDAPNSGPINGIVRCGSSAETQSQLQATGVYHEEEFEVELPDDGCIDPSTGQIVDLIGPTEGQPVIWLNFDVRANSGSYEIQINDNSGDEIGWALYASNSPMAGTVESPLTGEHLSGDPSDLQFLTCGVESSSTWNTLPVPQFNVPTNCYMVIWDQEADGDVAVNNFKARFGCGDSDVELCSVAITNVELQCTENGLYAVDITIEGINGYYQLSDEGAAIWPSPAIVCLGNVATDGDLFGTFTFYYESGTDYNITVEALTAVSGCSVSANYNDCVVSTSGEGLDCVVSGCTDPCACNFDSSASVLDDSCIFDCYGCTYESASNYDEEAIMDDGSCLFGGCTHSGCYSYNPIANDEAEGDCANPPGFADFNQDGIITVSDLQDLLSAYTSFEPDWNDLTWVQEACNGASEDQTASWEEPEQLCELSGCIYPQAMNYNPQAIQDPGVCAFAGCIDSNALNFNPHANIEDGSCKYVLCPDFNSDGLVQVHDLMDVLSVFGHQYD